MPIRRWFEGLGLLDGCIPNVAQGIHPRADAARVEGMPSIKLTQLFSEEAVRICLLHTMFPC